MNKAVSPVLQLIRRSVEDGRVNQVTDRELLHRFRSRRDEAAFHSLVRRHGAMVFDVCRNVLGNDADAEDAFQATFLVLAQKAGAIRKQSSVGSWLHGVAFRTALKSRAKSARRQQREARAPARPAAAADLSWAEVREVLHAELESVSPLYRTALVLCYLEGKTQAEAAAALGVSAATVNQRLERGRAILRARLVRRGLGPAAVGLAAWPLSAAQLRSGLVEATTDGVRLLAAGPAAAGAIPDRVIALTQGELKTMSLTKLKTAVILAVLTCGGLTTGVLAYRTLAAQQPDGSANAQVGAGAPTTDAAAGAREAGNEPPPPTPKAADVGIKKEAASTVETLEERLKLIGSWQLTRFDNGKDAYPDKLARRRRNIFEGTKVYLMSVDNVARTFTWTVDPTQSPKEMDWVNDKGEHWRGIYALDGEELKVCFFTDRPVDRPADFKPAPGKDLSIFRLMKPGEKWKVALFATNFESVKKPDWVTRPAMKSSDADNAERKLLIARSNEALAEMKDRYQYLGFVPGELHEDYGSVGELILAARRLLSTDLELTSSPTEQIAIREKYLDFAKNVEEACRLHAFPCEGYLPRMTVAQARAAKYMRLEAELDLLRAKGKDEKR